MSMTLCQGFWRISPRSSPVLFRVAIALALGAACIWFAERDVDVKWLSLVFETFVVFGYAIGTLRRFWRQPVFWFGVAAIFVIHTVAFALILRQVSQWRAPVVGLIAVIEAGAVVLVVGAAVERSLKRAMANRQRLRL